jgi:hypothetical protein
VLPRPVFHRHVKPRIARMDTYAAERDSR